MSTRLTCREPFQALQRRHPQESPCRINRHDGNHRRRHGRAGRRRACYADREGLAKMTLELFAAFLVLLASIAVAARVFRDMAQ